MADQITRYNHFTGGLVTDPPVASLLADDEFSVAQHVVFRKRGTITLRPGERSVFSISAGVIGLARFTDVTGPLICNAQPSAPTGLLPSGMGGFVYARDVNTGAVIETMGYVASGAVRCEFAQMTVGARDWMFFVSRSGQYLAGNLAGYEFGPRKWARGFGGDALDLMMVPPAPQFPATAGIAGSGQLNSTGLASYRWYSTYVDYGGVESNPSPADTGGASAFANQSATVIINNGVYPNVGLKIKEHKIYRAGGALASPHLVSTQPRINLSFTDNMSDYEASLQPTLERNHDAPGNHCKYIAATKTRLFLADDWNVYVSSLLQPWYFPQSIENYGADGKVFGVDPDSQNPIVGLTGTGSGVLILKMKNVFLFQGETLDSMSLVKVADVGCGSGRSAVMCQQNAVWVSPDGIVWMLGSNGVENISNDIQRTLDAVPASAWLTACATYRNQAYHLSVPDAGSSGLYLIYDFNTGAWTDETGAWTKATKLYAGTGSSDGNEILMATAPGYTLSDGSSYTGVVAAFSATDTTAYPVLLQSGDLDMDTPNALKQLLSVRVRGKLTKKVGTSPTITLTSRVERSDGSVEEVSRSYPLSDTTAGTMFTGQVDSVLVGEWFRWRIDATATVFELASVELGWRNWREVVR